MSKGFEPSWSCFAGRCIAVLPTHRLRSIVYPKGLVKRDLHNGQFFDKILGNSVLEGPMADILLPSDIDIVLDDDTDIEISEDITIVTKRLT